MSDLEPEGETEQPDESRSLLRPLLVTLALAALLVVMLAVSFPWTVSRISRADAALGGPHYAQTAEQRPASLQQRRATLAASARIIPGLMGPMILALLAFGGYQGWSAVQRLSAAFAGRIGRQQERLSALRRRQFLLSATLNGVGDAVITADVGGRITFLNSVAEKLTAWQEADAVGREVKAVLTLVDERTGAALADPATATLAASVRLDFPPHAAQVALTGERRPIAGSGTPIWEEHGKSGGVALVFRDIPERRSEIEALRDMKAHRLSSEARAEAILETALDCVVLMRQGGEIAGFNPAAERSFGWTSRQALGRPVADLLFPAASRAGFQREVLRSQAAEASSSPPVRAESCALTADGREFPVEMTITPIPQQEAPLFAIHLRDISDRRDAENALRRAQDAALAAVLTESREKSALLANMSDELRTPLSAVIGYSEMLQEEVNDRGQSDLVPDLQKIHGAGKHLLSLINDILDLSKIEAGQIKLYPETFDVTAMLEDVARTVQPTLAKNGNTLIMSAGKDLGVMYADHIKVKQSLLNLLSNAAGFSRGRTVALDANREHDQAGDWITFRLADASADQPLPLDQQMIETDPASETSGPPRFSGHGLALVIARRFCQMQGGEFTGSREPGRGAVYRLRFPARV